MKVIKTALPGVVILEPRVFGDDRGFFLETWSAPRYAEAGITAPFVQTNHSRSRRGVLRGLHFQRVHPQGKLVRVARGTIFDVVADVRPGSPTFGQWVGATLSDTDHRQLYLPPGYAHGFCVLSEVADFEYACTALYHPEDEGGVAWDDPTLGIEWPIEAPALSARDEALPPLSEMSAAELPRWSPPEASPPASL